MKKIFFLFLLLPYLCAATFYEGTIKFTNSSTQNGYIEYPSLLDQDIKFKSTLKDKAQKFSINEIDEIEFRIKGQETIRLIATKINESTMKGKIKGISDQKQWLRVYYDGKLKMYSGTNVYTSYGSSPNGFSREYQETGYYIKSPTKDYPQLVFKPMHGIGVFNLFKTQMSNYFEEDCPSLVESLDKSILKEKKYYLIGEFYDKNCGK